MPENAYELPQTFPFHCFCKPACIWPHKTGKILWCHHWFPREMRSEKKVQKVPYWWKVTTQIWVVLLTGWSKFPPCGTTNNQKHCKIWVVTYHQYGFSALVSETSFHGETSDSVAKCSKINAKSRICFTTELKINHQSFSTTAESSCYCWLITYNTSMKSFSKWDIPTYLQ